MRNSGVEQDTEDFGEFYRRARHGCLRAVRASVDDRQLAEDLVAEAFARALASWHKVARHPAPAAWVVRTALNGHVSWWRRRRREVALTDHHDTAGDDDLDYRPDAAVLALLRALPVRQREVIALRVFLDLDTATTAQVLGIAPGTVTAHLSRAVATLRDQFLVLTGPGS